MRRFDTPRRAPRGLLGLATLGTALILSVAWIGIVRGYVSDGPGWDALTAGTPADLALFGAAAAAPLAALWLVAAFVLIAIGLAQTQAEMRAARYQAMRTTGEIEALVRTTIEMQEQSRRQSFLSGVDLALKDLNSHAGLVTGRLGILSPEESEYLWAMNAAGDPWAFSHALLARAGEQPDFADRMAERVAADEVAAASLHRFLRRYERLLALARDHDADKLVREVLEDGPLDRLFMLFDAVSARVQALMTPAPDGADGTVPPADPWDPPGPMDSDPWPTAAAVPTAPPRTPGTQAAAQANDSAGHAGPAISPASRILPGVWAGRWTDPAHRPAPVSPYG
ncbi:hypothetical protein [Roseospira navarrensis]|uniref:Uncharacterized protein n=1 Tax=Roseospira navarrensis TaxID=140058 RepID=A0A7X2D1R3_9PROT|nr:hypothetical protein [Roseospira navarrensis]MQX35424.1 hypothetical protein [Roseospira navarrensis]